MVGSVSATEQNDDLQVTNDTDTVSTGNDTVISVSDSGEVLGDAGTFTELQGLINDNYGKTITLQKDYAYTSDVGRTLGINITNSITIDGNGKTIDGNNARIFTITGANVKLTNLRLINANSSAGAVSIEASASNTNVTNSVFDNCSSTANGGVFYIHGPCSYIANCNFTNNHVVTSGGALNYQPTTTCYNATVLNCRFVNCHSDVHGGAIETYSNHGLFKNLTFINCTAGGSGGAIALYNGAPNTQIVDCHVYNCSAKGNGGAIWSNNVNCVNTSISNCEFSGCNATNGGAIYFNSANTTITQCDFNNNLATNNGGAVSSNAANSTIDDCTFVDNSASDGANYYASSSANTIEIVNCDFDLLYVSPTSTYDSTKADAGTTLEKAITWDDAYGKIKIGGKLMLVGTFTNLYGKSVSNSLIIEGYNNAAIIDLGKHGRAFVISGNNVIVTGITFKNGQISDNGGAIKWTGANGNLTNCVFKNNNATLNGGAVYWTGASGTIDYCKFEENLGSGTTSYGGAVWWQANNANLKNTNFTGNYVLAETNNVGGALHYGGSYFNINNCRFIDNHADVAVENSPDGGAIDLFTKVSYYVNITNCTFKDNTARGCGADMVSQVHNFNIIDCNFTNSRTLTSAAGSVWISGSNVTVERCIFDNCSSNYAGGALVLTVIYNSTVSNSTFKNNKADTGGAIALTQSNNNITIDDCYFENNTARSGGACYIANPGTNASISNSNFTNNNATQDGGAIYISATNSTVTDCNFTGNNAINTGGAIYIGSSTGTFSKLTFNNNNAPDGADIYIASSSNEIEIDDNIKFDLMYVTNSGTGNGLKRDTPTNWTHAIDKIEEGGRIVLIGDFSSWTTKTISKSLTIEGSEASLTAASNNGFFIVNAGNVHIDNVELKNMIASTYAIVWNGEGGIISNSTFTNNRNSGKAANIKSTKSLSVLNNTFDVTVNYNSASLSVDYDNDFAVTASLEGMDLSSSYANLDVTVGSTVETTTQMKNTISFSLAKRLPGTYTLNLATTDSNTNTYNYLSSSNTATLTVNRLNTIYIGPSATGSGNGTSTSNLATWDGIASRLSDDGTIVFANGNYNLYGKSISKPWTLTASSASNVIINGNGQATIFSIDTTGVKIYNLTLINASKPITDSNVVTVKDSVLENQIEYNIGKSSYVYGETITITGSLNKISPSAVSAYVGNTLIGTSTGSTASYSISRNGGFAVGSYTLSATKKQEKRRIV